VCFKYVLYLPPENIALEIVLHIATEQLCARVERCILYEEKQSAVFALVHVQ